MIKKWIVAVWVIVLIALLTYKECKRADPQPAAQPATIKPDTITETAATPLPPPIKRKRYTPIRRLPKPKPVDTVAITTETPNVSSRNYPDEPVVKPIMTKPKWKPTPVKSPNLKHPAKEQRPEPSGGGGGESW